MTHSLYVKLSKNSKDYGEPDITYQLADAAEQRPTIPRILGIGAGNGGGEVCNMAKRAIFT